MDCLVLRDLNVLRESQEENLLLTVKEIIIKSYTLPVNCSFLFPDRHFYVYFDIF